MISTLSKATQDFLEDPTATWGSFKASLETSKKLSVSDYVEISYQVSVFAFKKNAEPISYWSGRNEPEKITDLLLDSENDPDVSFSLFSALSTTNIDLFKCFWNKVSVHMVKMLERKEIAEIDFMKVKP